MSNISLCQIRQSMGIFNVVTFKVRKGWVKKGKGVWRICIQRQPEGKKWILLKYASKESKKLCSPFYGRLEKFHYIVVITDKIRKVKSLYRLFLLSLQSVYQTLSKTTISDKKWAKPHKKMKETVRS